MTLNDIEALAERYANAANEAADLVNEAELELAGVRQAYLKSLRARAERVAETKAALLAAVQEAPELWAKPRTRVLHGVKVGMTKQPGALTWDDDAKVVAKIKAHYVDEIGVLIKTTEKPVKDALAELPAADLKRLGITVVATGDKPVARLVAGDIEKLIKVLSGHVEDDVEVEA